MLYATPLLLPILLGGPPACAALEVEPMSLHTGSSFYLPAMGVSPAEVYWNPSSPPCCTGLSIISVMLGVARPFTSQLQGRVDERLSNGSIVIRSLRPEDGGFYVVCAESTSTPVGTILLTVTERLNVCLAPGSVLYIPTQDLEMAAVHWSRASTPDCRGHPIITVLPHEPRVYTSLLDDRVDKTLLNGSIVIRRIQEADGGFYTVCNNSKKSRITLNLTVIDTPPAVTPDPTSASPTPSGGGRTHWWVLAPVSIAAAAGIAMAILVWKRGLVEQQDCNGASGRRQAEVEMALRKSSGHAQQNNGAPGIL